MEIKSKNLNAGECYACSIKDIRHIFQTEQNLYVSFGFLSKSYKSDTKFINHPQINGLIIASMQINKREKVSNFSPILSFYVINDSKYNEKYRNAFSETVIPSLHEWYRETLSRTSNSLPGVEVLLVEWTGAGFKLHNCRFA